MSPGGSQTVGHEDEREGRLIEMTSLPSEKPHDLISILFALRVLRGITLGVLVGSSLGVFDYCNVVCLSNIFRQGENSREGF